MMKNFGKSFTEKGTLQERWSSAIKDPAYWLVWIILLISISALP